MSSKTKNQKPANSKPDAEIGDEAISPQDTAEESTSEAEQQYDSNDQPDNSDQAEKPEVPSVIETVAEQTAVDVQPLKIAIESLATRLTKVVSAIATTAKPESVHALHKVEMIVGSLKVSLSAAIDACADLDDESLKADLQSLLAIL